MLPALRRHWIAALIPLVLFVAGALVLAVKRPPRYTSTAVLSVGHVYVSNPVGIPTVIEATQSLAAVYSRAIHSGAVVDDTRRALQRSSTHVSGSLSATPIPQSPLIKVSAESSTQAGAVALANASAAALATYVNGQVRDNSASATLSQRYRGGLAALPTTARDERQARAPLRRTSRRRRTRRPATAPRPRPTPRFCGARP